MGFPKEGPIYCPRCDRIFSTIKEKRVDTINRVKKHVAEQHPDHDSLWYETYPNSDDELRKTK